MCLCLFSGREMLLRGGGHISCGFQALNGFVSSAPGQGQQGVCGDALQQWHGPGQSPLGCSHMWQTHLSFLECKTCVLLMYRNCMKQTRALFFSQEGLKNGPLLFLLQ